MSEKLPQSLLFETSLEPITIREPVAWMFMSCANLHANLEATYDPGEKYLWHTAAWESDFTLDEVIGLMKDQSNAHGITMLRIVESAADEAYRPSGGKSIMEYGSNGSIMPTNSWAQQIIARTITTDSAYAVPELTNSFEQALIELVTTNSK